jgi:hypothetical protein
MLVAAIILSVLVVVGVVTMQVLVVKQGPKLLASLVDGGSKKGLLGLMLLNIGTYVAAFAAVICWIIFIVSLF